MAKNVDDSLVTLRRGSRRSNEGVKWQGERRSVFTFRSTLIGILGLSTLAFSPTVIAEEQNGWQLDSLKANATLSKPDAQKVYEVLLKMLDRWNAHDIEVLH